MRIVGQLIRVVFLFTLLLLIVGAVLAQTDYAKKYLSEWIEKKTEGQLKIGKIEGILPFWAHLHDVHFHNDTTDGVFDTLKISLMPATLFFGRITIVDVQVGHATVTSHNDAWPTFPFPIDIHAFTIEHLCYNGIENVRLEGMAELSDDFFLQFSLCHPKIPEEVRLTIQGDKEKELVHLLAQWEDGKQAIWLSGDYQWNTQIFTGNWHGERDGFNLNGIVEANLKTRQLITSGKFLERPFVVKGDFNDPPGPITFNYGDAHWKIAGKFDWATQLLTYHLFAHDLTWKNVYIPEIVMDGTFADETVHFSCVLPDFTVMDPAYEVFPRVRLHIDGSATTDQLKVQGQVVGLADQPLNLAAEVPLHLTFAPFTIDIDEEAPFFARIYGGGSIDPILAFLENASVIAHGMIDIDLQVTGNWNNPSLAGRLVFGNGSIESFTTGAVFRDVYMEMEGVGQTLQVRCLNARDVDEGSLSGSGEILWDPANGFPFALHLFANQYQILGVDPLTMSVNADIIISGSTQGMTIAGNATLCEGFLAIPSDMPVQIPCVDVCYINSIEAFKPEEECAQRIIPVLWDLTLNAERGLFIDGRGLDSEWGGVLHITGEQKDFQFSGKMNLVRGRFDIINQTFDLVHGRILIEGLEPKDIYVDLKGDYELPNLTASIIVTGYLDNTRVSFCSNPPMNMNQILSWILFGQDINELTPMQACRLASLLVTLSGKYSGPSTFDKIKDKLGIDVFSITDCDIDSADLTFQVGKYISQGTFVGVNKSISGDFDSVLIQTRLFRNFYLEADYGGSLNSITPNGGKVIFKWYKAY